MTDANQFAFPIAEPNNEANSGLTKLEEFAKSNMAQMFNGMQAGWVTDVQLKDMAEVAVLGAKALINALNKQQ